MKKEKTGIENAEAAACKDASKVALERLLSAPAYTDQAAAYRAILQAASADGDKTPASMEQWEQLYKLAKEIRELEPWQYLNDSEHLTILLPGRDEPVYIVVMGSGDLTYGIGIYPGYDSLRRLLEMSESDLDEEDISPAFEQHCINLYFGDREELEPKDKNVIKKLGLKFRGSNEWPYFRSMKPGFTPWYINHDEAELTIEVLQNFIMMCLALGKEPFEVNYKEGETLLRFYDDENDIWYNTTSKMPPAPFIMPKLLITDDILVARLKKIKKNKEKIGIAITYFPIPLQENRKLRPIMPRMAILIDMVNGQIIDQDTNIEYPTISTTVTQLLVNYVEASGRPASISAPDGIASDCVEDFASKLGIKLEMDERLLDIGRVITNMIDMMESGEYEGI